MDKEKPEDVQTAWADYWDGDTEQSGQALGHPAHAPRLKARWQALFAEEFEARSGRIRVLDAACGTGVVAGCARQAAAAAGGVDLDLILTDFAASAVSAALCRPELDGSAGFTSDAAALPVRDKCIDLVVSQFGLEYAGEGAFERAASAVAPGGALHAVIHLQDGEIYRECAENLQLLDAVADSAVLDEFFALFMAIRSGETESHVAELARKASAAGERVGQAISAAKPGAARQHASRLLGDMQQVLNRPAVFNAEDIKIWADGQAANIETYRVRMASMLRAGQDGDRMEALASRLRGTGFTHVSLEGFRTLDDAGNIAWMLTARRDRK